MPAELDLGAEMFDFGTPQPVLDGLDKLVPSSHRVYAVLEDGTETRARWHGEPVGWRRCDNEGREFDPMQPIGRRVRVVKWRNYSWEDWKVAEKSEGPFLQPDNALFEKLPPEVVP